MGDWSSPISSLGGEVLARLCQLLDITGCGWRRLAEVAASALQVPCSEEELEMCSLKVLEPHGSPAQSLLQLLAERNCTLQDLLGCLGRMGHMQACHVLSSAVQDTICIVEQPESQVVAEGTHVSLSCRAAGPPGLTYQWFCGRQEVPGATAPELVMDTAALRGRSEWFICRVNRGNAFTFSQWELPAGVGFPLMEGTQKSNRSSIKPWLRLDKVDFPRASNSRTSVGTSGLPSSRDTEDTALALRGSRGSPLQSPSGCQDWAC
ncbi:mucosa-associated lymphoid tissue lymphoma translocation protein 1-like [Pezoporus occidentalis]|uniref:mucosa-associated lymphoid tissue lymphoma translocation protein 1-like n=1 Tax=Pezoporus occidentalis TaxID=407982 RepID=UPI002F909C6F